jgi:cytochrome d ubiquinol oxidase subunit II
MATLWFALVAIMLAAYVVFDGFDLGAGILHLLVAKNDAERRQVLATIGPVWDGNEVWLLAAGGTLYFAFPLLYASGFSGFYLPLMIVLWLLILRGISIEFRNHIESPVWTPLWDVVFSVSSLLLAVFFGAALGNVVRGVPLDEHGRFFEPLWTNFQVGAQNGILDWYTVLIGVAAALALTLHGALWLALKTGGPVQSRSLSAAARIWWAVAAATLVITVVTFRVQPLVPKSLGDRPWGLFFPVLALAGLAAMRFFLRSNETRAFLASCVYLIGMLTSVVFGVYPMVLPASTSPEYSLTIHNAKAPDYGLQVGLVWWVIGMILVTGYFVFTYRHFRGKVR